jgi:hypothetical protein
MPLCGGCDKNFDWDDIVHNSDDLDGYLNLIDLLSMEKYGKTAVDLTEETEISLHSLHDSFNGNIKPVDALRKIRLLQAKELWSKLGDIPVNDEDEIDEDFLHFETGTDKFDVWHWFEDEFVLSVAEDLMFLNKNPE